MKRFLSVLLTMIMLAVPVMETVAFAAPSAVTVSDTTSENEGVVEYANGSDNVQTVSKAVLTSSIDSVRVLRAYEFTNSTEGVSYRQNFGVGNTHYVDKGANNNGYLRLNFNNATKLNDIHSGGTIRCDIPAEVLEDVHVRFRFSNFEADSFQSLIFADYGGGFSISAMGNVTYEVNDGEWIEISVREMIGESRFDKLTPGGTLLALRFDFSSTVDSDTIIDIDYIRFIGVPTSIGTSSTTITSDKSVYSTSQEEILKSLKIDTNEMLQNISCGNHPIKGPSVTFLGKTFYLFEFDGKLNFNFKKLNVQANVDADEKTVQFLVGYKVFDESADLGEDYNDSAYWSQSYNQIKSLYKGVTGKNVDTTKLWNQFSSLRGQLKEFDSDLLVDAKCKVAGFLELSYETGSAKFSEGGFLMEASVGGEFVGRVPAFPAAYVVLGLEASLEGKIFVAYEKYFSINSELNAEFAANVGIGLGSKKAKTYLEGGLVGTLGAKMLAVSGSFKDYTTTFNPLTVTIKGEVYLKGSLLGFLNGEKKWPIGDPIQLYPKNNASLMSFELFGEETVDDVIANATPLPRDYLYDAALMSIDDSDKLYSDKSIYSYNAPVLTTLSDGSILLLWIDDVGTKNDVNKTSLMYSTYDGEIWSEAKELFETGCYNGAPAIFSDGETVHIIWTKAKTVFADDASLEELIVDTELNYTVYTNGEFAEPVVLTDNSLFEINYDVIENNGNVAVAWSENSENDPYMTSGTNSLYVRELVDGEWSGKELIAQSDSAISEIEIYYENDTLNCSYIIVDDDNSTQIYNNGVLLSDGECLNYFDGNLYFLTDSRIMSYDISSEQISETENFGVTNFSIHDGNAYTLVNDGFACELYESIYKDGEFSDWKQVTEFGKYIRDYSVTTDSLGVPVYALNLVEVNDGESVYGASELAVCKATDISAIEVSAVYYDETKVAPSKSLPLSIDVTNVGTTDINSLNVSITDKDGSVLSSGTVEAEISNGESATILYNYLLPSELKLHEITITLTCSDDERNIENNSIKTSIGYADILVQNVTIDRTENGAVASGTISNTGYADISNVVLSVYDASNSEEILSTIECGNIASGGVHNFTYDIPEKYLTLDDKMTMYGLVFEVDSDSSELNYANNSQKVVFGELTDYTVAFVDGNQLLDIVSVDEFESYTVEKEGFVFDGWYTSPSFEAKHKVTEIPTDISENIIVFAKWISEDELKKTFQTSMQAFLNLESIVTMSVGYKLEGMEDINPEEHLEKMGLLIWDADEITDESQATYDNCDYIIEGAVYNSEEERFESTTRGIAAKNMGDSLTFRAYYLNDDGSYSYSRLISNYSPKRYCYNQINNSDDEEVVALMVAILNYGAAAQTHFGYNTDNLMNSDLSEDLKVLDWDGSLVRSDYSVPDNKADAFERAEEIVSLGGFLNLEGAIDYNFYAKTDFTVENATIYYWTEAVVNSLDELTLYNATSSEQMAWDFEKERYEGKYEGQPAKKMFQTVYALIVLEDENGQEYYGGVVGYSPERFAYINQNKGNTTAELSKRLAVYGNAARTYFNK